MLKEDSSNISKGVIMDFELWKNIKIGTGLSNANDLSKAFKQRGYKILEWGEAIIGAPNFTVTKVEQQVNLVRVSVEDLGFEQEMDVPLYGDSVSRNEIYDRAISLGLKLCHAEVGPQLRLQYPDQPVGESLIIAMESIKDLEGTDSMFLVAHDEEGLWLSGSYGDPDGYWKRSKIFIFTF